MQKSIAVLIEEAKKKYPPNKVEKNPLVGVECVGYLMALKDIYPEYRLELIDLIRTYEFLILVSSM